MRIARWLAVAGLLVAGAAARAVQTPLAADDLDPAAFAQWVDGAAKPLAVGDGPRHVIWTQTTAPQWDGVRFSDSRATGPRYLRIGWKRALPVGSILARAGGQVSVLKPTAPYPGNPADDSQWVPAVRIVGRTVARPEAGQEDYAVWVLPAVVATRAVRIAHTPAPTDRTYAGWLGGVCLLSHRYANLAPQATADASGNAEKARLLNDESANGTWHAWDMTAGLPLSPERPAYVTLVWPKPVTLTGLAALWTGFSAAEAQAYAGPADGRPATAPDSQWRTVASYKDLPNQYPRALGVNWLDFSAPVTTRAVRLRITAVTREDHPHLNGNTKGGTRIWLGELMAMQPIGAADLKTAILPVAEPVVAHAPIPVRFMLKEPGYVTLVIEDAAGRRVRNLVSATPFPAGKNVVWWDGTDDLGRDPESARHGIYAIPAQFIAPGKYRVRGLFRKGIDLRYEFSVYTGGSPAWETEDGTGGWLTNHTPPQAALFLPADRAPGGKPLVYLGSFVSEGGSGLAWVDMEGRKQGGRGWVGGNWTAAPYLARDDGPDRDKDVYAYVGSPWSTDDDPNRPTDKRGEIRLTGLTTHGDKAILKYTFTPPKPVGAAPAGDGQWGSQMSGLAARDGLLAVSLTKLNQLLFVDAKAGKVVASVTVDDPRGVAFDKAGQVLVLSGRTLVRITFGVNFPAENAVTRETVVSTGLEDPWGLAIGPDGAIYVSDRGPSHQVKVFGVNGFPQRTVGRAGAPKAGPYDPLHMNNPAGLAVDDRGRLWVTEADYSPKRVSVWTPTGELVKAFYGPGQYGGGGTLDGQDRRRFYYNGMEFALDWKAGAFRLTNIYYRPGPGELGLPDGYGAGGTPETPIYLAGRRYLTNCFNSNPTNGAPIAMLWAMRGGVARPVAAFGRANDWSLLKGEPFRARWPQGVDPQGDVWRNQAWFVWSDLNGDGRMQPDEVAVRKGAAGGATVMPDLSFVASRIDDRAVRLAPRRFTPEGVPVYNADAPEALVAGAQAPTSSGGDQALAAPNGWTVLTVAPKPFAPQGLGGAYRGTATWSYPSLWPGLHASHESPSPDRPGEIVGTTRLLGGFVAPRGSDAGPLWCVNGNQGNMYLFTADGLFVAELFRDVRQGKSWSMPVARRGMLLNDLTLHDENFWPSITQTADGQVYLCDGARTSIVRVDGLDTLRRIAAQPLSLTKADLDACRSYMVRAEAERQKTLGPKTLAAAIRGTAPTVDGKLDDWPADTDWASVDKRGVAAYFDSNTKPYDVRAAIAIAGDRLYVAFRTGDPELLRNSGETPNAPFKTGGALDLMLGVDPKADPGRSKPVAGDERLLVTLVKGKPYALLYRQVAPGGADPVPFSSPWRTIRFDRVDDVTAHVQLAGANGDYELSIPLSVLGLRPQPGMRLKGDLGVLRGNGFQTLQRAYWSNKATGITADVPSEAELTPQLWGEIRMEDRG